MHSLWHVDDLPLSRKDVRPQMQIAVLLASQVQQKIPICGPRGIDVCFVRKAHIVGVELLGKMNKLTTVAQILEQYDVLHIQTGCPHVCSS